MDGFGNFGFGNRESTAKLSKMLLQAKQVSSDITNIIPVSKDPELVQPNAKKKTALYEQIGKVSPPESTYYWDKETSDNFGKFVTEATAASAFAAQKGTYASPGSVTAKLMTYVMNIGMIAQKNAAGRLDLVRTEQQIAALGMRKAIERCMLQGHPATAASDGSAGDTNAFSGIGDLITTNVDTPTVAEALSLAKVDAQMDACIDAGAVESSLIGITDTYTLTKFASLYYNTINSPLDYQEVNAGLKLRSYRQMPIFVTDYFALKTTGNRQFAIIDTDSTKLAEFWGLSQIDLGRTTLSDDSIMFWMGALAVKNELRNAIITKIV